MTNQNEAANPSAPPPGRANAGPIPGSAAWWRDVLLTPARIESLRRVETPHLKAERAVQCLTNVLMIRNSDLLDCLPASITVALQTAVALGLEPGTYIHFVPFMDRDVGLICQTVVDYRGLIRIAMRSPLVAKIEARAVFPGDDFRVEYGDDERIVHVPNLESDARSGADLQYVYAIVTLSNGQRVRHVMTRRDVETIKGMAKGSSSKKSPWNDPHGYVEMARKTAARAVLKYVPVEESVAAQIRRTDATEFDFDNNEPADRAADRRPELPMTATVTAGNAAARGLVDELNARRAAESAAAPVARPSSVPPAASRAAERPAAAPQGRPAAPPPGGPSRSAAAPAARPAAPSGSFARPAADIRNVTITERDIDDALNDDPGGKPPRQDPPSRDDRPASRTPPFEIDEADIPF